jgi:type I restriction enzyme, R subunit
VAISCTLRPRSERLARKTSPWHDSPWRLRAEFQVKLKLFLTSPDLVLPRPEALPYVRDAKILGEIQIRAYRRYRGDERPIGKDVGAKVRLLIDESVISQGIDPKIPPISILDAEFDQRVDAEISDRAKASEMEHAARYHIRKHFDEAPELYEKLSERLKKILAELHDRWEQLVIALEDFVGEVRAGRQVDETGLDPETQAPFLGVLRQSWLTSMSPAIVRTSGSMWNERCRTTRSA